jgi:hypothetical protein
VDELFRHVLHYFDTIMVDDAVSTVLMKHDAEAKCLPQCLKRHLEVLLYLRQIGAEQLLTFRQKQPACEVHWKKHAKEAELGPVTDDFYDFVVRLAEEGEVRLTEKTKLRSQYVYIHPEFEHYVWIWLDSADLKKLRSEDELQKLIARRVVVRYLSHLASDVLAAKWSKSPMGSTVAFHRALLQHAPATIGSTAFELDLPVLNRVPLKDLITVRLEERELFERFQSSLRAAIRERVKLQTGENATAIASEIRQDLIDPELRRIRDRLRACEQLLSRQAATSVGVGVLTTVVGVLSGVAAPLVATAGVGGMLASARGALNKHLEERRDIAESDYYFLWRASGH